MEILHLVAALLAVVAGARLLGRLMVLVRQPPVVGEVLCGILLGPSLLGRAAPAVENWLFPSTLTASLALIAQGSVLLYMFVVGLDFDAGVFRRSGGSIAVVVPASIAAPFALGAGFAVVTFSSLAPPAVSPLTFALFMGITMCITAFPVLARMLAERNLTQTELGATALATAAISDVLGWCLLAVIAGAERAAPKGSVPGELAALFAVGAVVRIFWPRFGASVRPAAAALSILLLPAFFAVTGLRTQLGLLSSSGQWLTCGVIVLLAAAGKLFGTAIAGRAAGMSWPFAAKLGALMNARGLMELMVLNVGLDLRLITPVLFTMLVIMALATTAMTAPLLDAIPTETQLEAAPPRAVRLPG